MQKNLVLIVKYFKKIYKPTNNNLETSSNPRNKNVDTSPRYKNDNQIGKFRNQRKIDVAGARETIGSQIEEVPTADSGLDTEPLEKVDSNVIPDSPDMCDNDIQTNQNAKECDDERVALANLIANLTLDTEENKNILKQLKKAKASLTQETKECKSNLEESNTTRDSFLIALQSKQTGLVRNQSIQTIHMLTPKGSTFNGRPTFANPMYLKKAQSKKPCLYEIPYDTSDLANVFAPNREETLTLEKDITSKLNKEKVQPYNYTKQNSLKEIFKPASQEYHDQLTHQKENVEKIFC
ncbi:hypothetical protein Tco_1002858 [Tanacetum coccineum]|uniref:Uncharacterized protein n=1 Tax=Tanacetum coccineum TaxID=301880 RepID=A0ABQ5F8T7_9ASTR